VPAGQRSIKPTAPSAELAAAGPWQSGDQSADPSQGEDEGGKPYVVLGELGPAHQKTPPPPQTPPVHPVSDYAEKACRTAEALGKLASKDQHSPADALALYVRALSLLERAMRVTDEGDGMNRLRELFVFFLQQAEGCRTALAGEQEQVARPNGLIFDYAVSLAQQGVTQLLEGAESETRAVTLREAALLLGLLQNDENSCSTDRAALEKVAVPLVALLRDLESGSVQ